MTRCTAPCKNDRCYLNTWLTETDRSEFDYDMSDECPDFEYDNGEPIEEEYKELDFNDD
ncbi:MAG: hypothetical protein H3Z50_07700 [archaeon]|nr:hypothetical protein [archaeon]